VQARLVWHRDAVHPFTYGSRPATVVVPARLSSAPREILDAVFTHELLHVARRDWRTMIVEEVAAAPLWFHPAIWLARRELGQAREEIVDRATVAQTGARRRYVEMLLWLSEAPADGSALSLALLTARQLPRRIAALLSEVPMSRIRIVSTCAAILCSCVVSVAAAVRVMPLPSVTWLDDHLLAQPAASSQPGPLERQAYVAPRDAPPPTRETYVPPVLPASAAGEINAELRLVLDAQGRVAEARALKVTALSMTLGIDAVGAAVVDAARRWRFAPPAMAPLAVTASLTLQPTMSGNLPAYSTRERPVPVHIRNADYPDDAKKAQVEGTAQVEIDIDVTGRVAEARLVSATRPSMGDAAIAALRQSTFRPGMKDGQAVPVTVTIMMRFALK
jgi:TonB family protein